MLNRYCLCRFLHSDPTSRVLTANVACDEGEPKETLAHVVCFIQIFPKYAAKMTPEFENRKTVSLNVNFVGHNFDCRGLFWPDWGSKNNWSVLILACAGGLNGQLAVSMPATTLARLQVTLNCRSLRISPRVTCATFCNVATCK